MPGLRCHQDSPRHPAPPTRSEIINHVTIQTCIPVPGTSRINTCLGACMLTYQVPGTWRACLSTCDATYDHQHASSRPGTAERKKKKTRIIPGMHHLIPGTWYTGIPVVVKRDSRNSIPPPRAALKKACA